MRRPLSESKESMKRYPVFRRENGLAYATVMGVWALVSLGSATVLNAIGALRFRSALVWSAVTTLLGMGIMFVASLINLTKLRPGYSS